MLTENEVFEGETMQTFSCRNLLPGLKNNTGKSITTSENAASERVRLHGGPVGVRNQPVPGKRGMKRDLRMKRAACVRCSGCVCVCVCEHLEKVHKECWCEPVARKKTLAAALCTDWRRGTAF